MEARVSWVTRKKVLAAMVPLRNWHRVVDLAAAVGLSARTVDRALREMYRDKLVERQPTTHMVFVDVGSLKRRPSTSVKWRRCNKPRT